MLRHNPAIRMILGDVRASKLPTYGQVAKMDFSIVMAQIDFSVSILMEWNRNIPRSIGGVIPRICVARLKISVF